jgi:hypothetical protein
MLKILFSLTIFFSLFYSCQSKKSDEVNNRYVKKLNLVDSIQIDEIANFHFADFTNEYLLYWDYSDRKFQVYDFKGTKLVSFHLPAVGPKSFGETLINASIADSTIYALGVGELNSYDFSGKLINSYILDSLQFLFVSRVSNNNLHVTDKETLIANLSFFDGERDQKSFYQNQLHYFRINLKDNYISSITGFPDKSTYLNDQQYFDFQFTTFSDYHNDTLYFTYELENKIFKIDLNSPDEVDYIDLSYLDRNPPLGTKYGDKANNYDYLYINSVIEAISIDSEFIYLIYSSGVTENKLKSEFPDRESRQNGFQEFLANNNRKYLVVMNHMGVLEFKEDITELGTFIKADKDHNLYFRPSPFFSDERNYEIIHIYKWE